jgi:hypothetical protein
MTIHARAGVSALVGVAFLAMGCGGGGASTPTPFARTVITTHEESGPIGAQMSVCVATISSGPGPVNATLAPATFSLQLHSGECGTSAPLAEGTHGSLSATVPLGRYHFVITNPTDQVGGYTIRVDYPRS